MKKLISIVTPTFNESENIAELIKLVVHEFKTKLSNYDYEYIFIDNSSTDNTADLIKDYCKINKNIKLIVNSRNFGHIRSPVYAMKQAKGDAVISLVADLQDPPFLISEFIRIWEAGQFDMVLGVKKTSDESFLFFFLRNIYYSFVTKVSEIKLIKNFTGFGLYDRKIINVIKLIDDPYPYWRGLICDIGFSRYEYAYNQPIRKKGISKNNFYTLFDIGMLGITSHSKIPLRACSIFGFIASLISFIIAVSYFIIKLIHWDDMSLGIAPLVIGIFFFGSIQLLMIGILGEYIGNIYTQVLKRPLVVEKEKINF